MLSRRTQGRESQPDLSQHIVSRKLSYLFSMYPKAPRTRIQANQNLSWWAIPQLPDKKRVPGERSVRVVKKKTPSFAQPKSLCWKDFIRVYEARRRYSFHLLKDQKSNSWECICQSIQEARKSKFKEFYLSMVKDNYGDPHFQVKNYLFKEEIKILTDQDIFEDLTKTMEKQVKNVRQLFISENKKVEQKKK